MATKNNDIIREIHRESMAYLNRDGQAAFIRECRRRQRRMKSFRDWAKGRLHSMWCDANHSQNERHAESCNRRHRFKAKMAED